MKRWLGSLPILGLLLVPACEWSGSDEKSRPNLPPSVQITGGATEGANADYRVEFFWFGSDPDGFVDHFLYAVDDTCFCAYEDTSGAWVQTSDVTICTTLAALPDSIRPPIEFFYESADSIWKRIDGFSGSFNFQAEDSVPGVDPALSQAYHTFYVKAVDDQNARSQADHRFFNAVTVAPSVRILAPLGRGAEEIVTVSADFAVRWQGRDEDSSRPDKKPVGYQLKLVTISSSDIVMPSNRFIPMARALLRSPNSRNLLIPDQFIVDHPDSVTSETYLKSDWYPKLEAPYRFEEFSFKDLAARNYLLAVRAVDEAGAIMPYRDFFTAGEGSIQWGAARPGNMLKIDVNPALAVNPHITLRERSLLGSYIYTANGQRWEVEVPVNVPLLFEWEGDASWYGSQMGKTNYALDIPDPGCEVCQEPDGIGGWAGWGSWERIPFPIQFSEDASGEQHILYIRGRDLSNREDHQIMAVVIMDVVSFPLDRTALWVDDFIVSAFNDCFHDAVISPIVNYAIESYLPFGQEEIEEHQTNPPVGDCGEQSNPGDIRLSQLGRYKLLYWNVSAMPNSTLGKITDPTPGSPTGRYLSIYVQSGGNLIVWGRYDLGALLGDFMPANRYIPELDQFGGDANFGPGSFVWDVLQLRTMFDRAGRPNGAGWPQMKLQCSGMVGIEATAHARELGFPVGKLDPTGYSEKTALWYDRWAGRMNPIGWQGGNAMLGNPPLSVAGMDTLYNYLSNSWAWQRDDLSAVCGSAFLSPFQGRPIAVRYDNPDPLSAQGKVVWIGVPLYIFGQNHLEDLKQMMRLLTDWVLTR